ncbi:uncharacterized protein KGF55_002280 [Candida pseudojiufengensis]|uniref:uncharacterized protein n=1 Tax=Candida pseudojiufengensis TaxID=497109 RepID=UPI002224B431|nr:uncharacterized protein KGF55_002280 [Candida pseudojiufengensis]KAI5964338.1 hypothetical protein KGF55_002280 [Candida pseudojiufengensis]
MTNSKFVFKQTKDVSKLKELFTLCGTQWGGPLTPEEFGVTSAKSIEEFLNSKGGTVVGFYLEDSTNENLIVACTIIRHQKALYKLADRSSIISSTPDPTLFGVKNITALLVSFVFTHEKYRKQGLAESCISQAIESTEQTIIDEKLENSVESQIDNFKKMTINDYNGGVDRQLANYYLGKEYVWFLYSGVDTYYERFGFKPYPMDFYQIPTPMLTNGQELLLETLIEESEKDQQTQLDTKSRAVGKRIKLLRWDNKQDQDIIEFIYQTKELEILAELNKLTFHSDLQSDHKSATSLTGLTSILSMTKQHGSSGGLSSIAEKSLHPQSGINNATDGSRRKSSAMNETIPKFSIKPSYADFRSKAVMEQGFAKTKESLEFSKIEGAILTNDLQNRSYYILWNSLKGEFFITGMGEISYESLLPSTNQHRRGSSFTGLNELGGYNFQDLDILVGAAIYNAKKRSSKFKNVYVSTTDLPNEIPDPVMYDFFINYFPFSTFADEEHHEAKKEQRAKGEEKDKISLIVNGSKEVGVLPMVKKFGSKKLDFELNWLDNGMWCWG